MAIFGGFYDLTEEKFCAILIAVEDELGYNPMAAWSHALLKAG